MGLHQHQVRRHALDILADLSMFGSFLAGLYRQTSTRPPQCQVPQRTRPDLGGTACLPHHGREFMVVFCFASLCLALLCLACAVMALDLVVCMLGGGPHSGFPNSPLDATNWSRSDDPIPRACLD